MTNTARPILFQTGPIMDPALAPALAEHFTVLMPEALEEGQAGQVRGIVSGVGREVDDELMARFPALEIVANFGVGYDSVDVDAAQRRNVMVTHTPSVLDEEVADLTLGLLLATVRRIPQADRYVREGRWPEGAFPLSPSLRGRKVGMVGLGRIGLAVARRLEGFGVPVLYHTRNRRADVPYIWRGNLVELAREVDVLVVLVPGGAQTRHLVNADVLEALGPQGLLVNVARGSVVDEVALVEALRSGRIGAAGLDVFAQEPHVPEALMSFENVVVLPHVGSGTFTTRAAMGQLVVDNLRNWFAGRGAVTPVPECAG
ncbi:2-hydroxyacid dehydrogenase [Xanthobacter sp. TB0139]|uniref:2-hydroxyacid dehydrogenase n=1 Tax=Xanthobacter sp. TB0139 TaxID=3459178 RepID=UPI004039DF80